MRKILTASIAAVTAAAAVAATAAPAESRPYHHRRHNNNDAAAAAAIAGVAGLALGAALANNGNSRSYYNYGYAPRYGYDYRYDRPYGYGYSPAYGYRTCTAKERFYDPYVGRHVTVKRRYAC